MIFKGIKTFKINTETNGQAKTVRFPSQITFNVPGSSTRATLKSGDVEINGETEPEDFDQICPEGLDRGFIR